MLSDIGVGISDGSAVVGDDVGHLVGAESLGLDLAELELGFLGVDLVGLISSLHVVENSEMLSSLVNGNNIHDSEWVSGVLSDLAIDFNVAILILDNLDDLLSGEGISESVLEENAKGNRFSCLVWAGGGLHGVSAAQLVQHPVVRGCEPLHVLLWSSSLITIAHILISTNLFVAQMLLLLLLWMQLTIFGLLKIYIK